MHIFIIQIRTKACLPQRGSNKPLLIDIDPSLTIKKCERKNIGRTLEDEQTVASYDYIKNRSTINTVILSNAFDERYRVCVSIISSGDKREVINLDIFYHDTVSQVKHAIYERTAIPVEEQRILFAGKQLENDRIFSDYSIQNGSTVHLVVKDMNRNIDVPPTPIEAAKSTHNNCNIQ
ncbi:unnamed protein product [Rotaria socialis]|uniref:Ubiquitin-like domain-containing protein n=1 Tax=Rotaria socialis TaxID=392032 RepID=A0A818GW43_9BILA|nr:unnamed protein product [Rotaria socialis]CAF4495791.1 unnamed protein product [Rotaria socialis]